MLLTEFLKEGISSLEGLYPSDEARSIILMLCQARIGTKSYTHIVEPDYVINDSSLPDLKADLARLMKNEPIQYVIGKAEFCGYTFNVNNSVLIPRPETEILCKEAVKIGSRIQRMRAAYGKTAESVRILDICTGSGNIAWTMALSIPGAKVIGVDISEKALAVAESQNFNDLLKEKDASAPQFMQADILEEDLKLDYGSFDLILSNPPYILNAEKPLIRPNVLEYEPAIALFVPDDDPLVFYKAIAKWSSRFLSSEGRGLAEINETLAPECQEIFKSQGFSSIDVMKDIYDKNRFVLYMK
ncbi:MAG: peptide chain release factor N(5)-glutamine methyltransferase [Bacteroidales bacterium]|jgi:release factor glutamine methyltransferase|nr:peptide chain release factor N(5)-glutamine methyltransferase [Bacteroidales bacterium]MCI1784949.1 peptide chain release factor N(5)-glutamine methyltransferase [Bacteroidales bacterium]